MNTHWDVFELSITCLKQKTLGYSQKTGNTTLVSGCLLFCFHLGASCPFCVVFWYCYMPILILTNEEKTGVCFGCLRECALDWTISPCPLWQDTHALGQCRSLPAGAVYIGCIGCYMLLFSWIHEYFNNQNHKRDRASNLVHGSLQSDQFASATPKNGQKETKHCMKTKQYNNFFLGRKTQKSCNEE